MKEKQDKKEEETKRKRDIEFEKIEKQREQRRIENERRALEEKETVTRQTRRQKIEEEERVAQRSSKTKTTSSNDLIQNQDLLDQIARLNRNRTQMRESLNKTRSNSKQSKH